MSWKGKVVLITGGTTGIGAATARMFRDEGARVIVTGRNPTTLAAARDALRDIEVFAADTGDEAAVQALFAHMRSAYGRLDVLFVNAAVVPNKTMDDMSVEEFDESMRVNVRGAWLTVKYGAPLMESGGAVILTGSISSYVGWPGATAYGASKAAIRAFGRSMAGELVSRGIRVNVLSPGPTDSGVIAKGRDAETVAAIESHLKTKIPMARLGHVDEVARAALFLASPSASFITGEELMVDGGMTNM